MISVHPDRRYSDEESYRSLYIVLLVSKFGTLVVEVSLNLISPKLKVPPISDKIYKDLKSLG